MILLRIIFHSSRKKLGVLDLLRASQFFQILEFVKLDCSSHVYCFLFLFSLNGFLQ